MPYKTIFLDWDGTLCKSRFWGHLAGENPAIYEIIQKDFFVGQPDFLGRWMRGRETAETATNLVAQLTDASPNYILQHLERSCREMQFTSPELPDLIQNLRKSGVSVVIATDNMDTFRRWTVPALNLTNLVDDILDSYALRAMKRDVRAPGESAYFFDYLREHNIGRGESLLIDDGLKNKVVEEFGIDFCQVNEEQNTMEILQSLTL